jgi:hypothetical protein
MKDGNEDLRQVHKNVVLLQRAVGFLSHDQPLYKLNWEVCQGVYTVPELMNVLSDLLLWFVFENLCNDDSNEHSSNR